jgi:hypothetical protein
MKLSYFHKVLFLATIIPCFILGFGSNQPSEISRKQDLKFAGLTKTLVNLLKTRKPKSFILGAYEISMENLIDTDIAALFDCDSVIGNYLSEAGDEANYEMLSDVLKNTIWERFHGEDGDLFVNVYSDTTSDGMYLNFSVIRNREVSIPVVLNASDSCFSTSFDTTCTLKFEADIDLFLNVGMINSNNEGQGLQIRINKFSFELASDPEEKWLTDENESQDDQQSEFPEYIQKPDKTFPFYIEDKKFSAAARNFSIFASLYWYLTPEDATDFTYDEGHTFTMSYEQLEKGDFKWYDINLSSFAADLIMIPENEKWDSLTIVNNSFEFNYTIDNLFDSSGMEEISLFCDYWVKDNVTARNKKFKLK